MWNIYLHFAKQKAFVEGGEHRLEGTKNRRVEQYMPYIYIYMYDVWHGEYIPAFRETKGFRRRRCPLCIMNRIWRRARKLARSTNRRRIPIKYICIQLKYTMHNIYLLFSKEKAFVEGGENWLAWVKNRRVEQSPHQRRGLVVLSRRETGRVGVGFKVRGSSRESSAKKKWKEEKVMH